VLFVPGSHFDFTSRNVAMPLSVFLMWKAKGAMAINSVNDPKHWRDRAAAMRALAHTMKDAEAIKIMNRLADDYDKLADRATLRSDGQVPPGRPVAEQ
jgi:hypothetical protein